jgi:hypothetical protein
MGFLDRFGEALLPHTASLFDFGMDDAGFFLALIRACPPGSRLAFDGREPDTFVAAFHEWSSRADPDRFEADYYVIDDGFIAAAGRMARGGALDLNDSLAVTSPSGELLCTCREGFMVIRLAPSLAAGLQSLRGRPPILPGL